MKELFSQWHFIPYIQACYEDEIGCSTQKIVNQEAAVLLNLASVFP